jgi:hypothetical protein
LTAKASPCPTGATLDFRPVANPLRPSTERADRLALALTPSVIHSPSTEDSTPRCYSPTNLRKHLSAGVARPASRPELLTTRAGLGHKPQQSRAPLIDSTPPRRWRRPRVCTTCRHAFRDQDTSLTARSGPTLSGPRAHTEQLLLPTDSAQVATSQQKMMPLTDLCNRLIVTSIRQMPNS